MLATTAEYHILCHSFATARGSIRELPDFNIRNEIDEIRLKSFVFLCHAALEEYLERVTLNTLHRARTLLLERRVVPKILISAITHYQIDIKSVWISAYSRGQLVDAILDLGDEAIKCHGSAVYENHGIKTKNQDNLCLPLGIRMHNFDHVLSQTLNAYGESRGRIAHGFRIEQKLPKAGCLQSTAICEKLLLPFDQELERLALEAWR